MGKRKRNPVKGQMPPRSAPTFPPQALAVLLFVLGAGLFWNTLGHGFVFDDTPLITQNLQVTEFKWGEMLGLRTGYRPVRTLTYAINYSLGGADPWGYHLFNVLLHALNGVLLFRLLLTWTKSLIGSSFGAILFLAHPVQTEAVAYVSGRKDLLATFFVLAALLVFMRFLRECRQPRLASIFYLLILGAAIFALAVLGVFSKEVALVFPALLLIAVVLQLGRDSVTQKRTGAKEGEGDAGFLSAWRRSFKLPWVGGIVAGAAAVSALGLYYALYVVEASRMVGFWGGSFVINFATSFKLFAHYLQLVLWPHPLIADYTGDVFPVSQGLGEPATLLSILLSAAFLGLAVWACRGQPLISAGMFWFLATLLPVLQIIPFHELAADRFLYLPLAGVALIAASAMQQLARPSRFQKVAWAGFAVVAVACSARAIDRNRDWSDQRTLWEATYESAPNSFRANTNLGRLYFEEGKGKLDFPLLRRGMAMTRRALELVPGEPLATANLGGMLLEQAGLTLGGRSPDQSRRFASRTDFVDEAYRLTHKALGLLQEALKDNTLNGAVLNNIGNCYKRFGAIWQERGDEQKALENRLKARQQYELALERDPRKEQKATWYNYAMLYVDADMHQEAIGALESFLRHFPNHADGNSRLGISLLEVKRHSEAADSFKKASQLNPSLDNLAFWAQAHQQAGQIEEAVRVYRILVQRYPQAYAGFFNLGVLYKQLGNNDLAVQSFQAVVDKSPDRSLADRARRELALLRPVKVTAEDVPR